MKKLILTMVAVVAVSAGQYACDKNWNDLVKENNALMKSSKYGFKNKVQTHLYWLDYYAKNVIIECDEGSKKQLAAKKALVQIQAQRK